MISFLKHAAQNIFVLIAICISLTACKTTAPPSQLENGDVITGLSGAAESQQEFTLTLPENVEALLIEVSGSSGVSLDLLDEAGVSVGSCSAKVRCYDSYPAAATYTVRISATEAYSDVSLTASWGGPDGNALSNSVELVDISATANSVQLKSFYVGFNIEPIQLTAGGQFASIEIVNKYGNTVHTCASVSSCQIPNIQSGLYYVRLTGDAEFSDGSLKLVWGSAVDATLANGIPKKGISGVAGTIHYEMFYLPEGAEAFLLQMSYSPVSISVISASGEGVGGCFPICASSDVEPGLYYVEIFFETDVFDLEITVAWAGEHMGTISNSDVKSGLFGSEHDQFLEAFYVHEGATAISHSVSQGVGVEQLLFNSQGDVVSICSSFEFCAVNDIEAGVYFLQTTIYEPLAMLSVSVAWAGPELSSLENGVPLSSLVVNENESAIHSFYLPEGVDGFGLSVSSFEAEVFVYDAYGDLIDICYFGAICSMQSPQAGVYFAQVQGFLLTDYTLSAAWAGEEIATLSNGVSVGEFYGEPEDRHLQSLYIPEGVEGALIVANVYEAYMEVLDSSGTPLTSCGGYEGCYLEFPSPGVYFIQVNVEGDQVQKYSLAAAWAGPEIATLNNGGVITGLQGSFGDISLQSVYIPEGTDSLFLGFADEFGFHELFAGPYISGFCQGWIDCVMPVYEPGPHFIRSVVENENAAFSISAAWIGESISSLENLGSVDIVGLTVEDVVVQSVHLPDEANAIFVSGSITEGEVRIYSSEGYEYFCYMDNVEENVSVCYSDDLPQGDYFIQYKHGWGFAADVSYSVAIAGETASTLQNGGIEALSANEGETLLQSFSVPEGVSYIGVTTSYAPSIVQVYGPLGQVTECVGGTLCTLDYAVSGNYFIRITALEDDLDFTLSVAWVGEGISSLTNGETLLLSDVDFDDTLLHAFSVTEGKTVSVQTSVAPHAAQLFDANGYQLTSCSAPCDFELIPAGDYFLRLTVDAPADEMALTVSW